MNDDNISETVRLVPSSADGGKELIRILEGKNYLVALPAHPVCCMNEDEYTDMYASIYGIFSDEEVNDVTRIIISNTEIIAGETDKEKLAVLLECFKKYGLDPGREIEVETDENKVIFNQAK